VDRILKNPLHPLIKVGKFVICNLHQFNRILEKVLHLTGNMAVNDYATEEIDLATMLERIETLENNLNSILTSGSYINFDIGKDGKIPKPSLNGGKMKSILEEGLKGSSFLNNALSQEKCIPVPELLLELNEITIKIPGFPIKEPLEAKSSAQLLSQYLYYHLGWIREFLSSTEYSLKVCF